MLDTALSGPALQYEASTGADDADWRGRGACAFYGPTHFFGFDGEPAGDRVRRELRAKTICGTCPVLVPCRDFALRVGEGFGIWGGTTERERRSIRRAENLRNRQLSVMVTKSAV